MPTLPRDSLPPLQWGFENASPAPLPLQESLPPLNLGFQEIDDQSLPDVDFGFQHSPPADSALPLPELVWGFEGVDVPPAGTRDVRMGSLPPLNLGFQDIVEDDDAAMDESLPPVIQERHGDQLPPLDLGFSETMTDVVNRAYNMMMTAINKLEELDVEENPARELVRNQIQRWHHQGMESSKCSIQGSCTKRQKVLGMPDSAVKTWGRSTTRKVPAAHEGRPQSKQCHCRSQCSRTEEFHPPMVLVAKCSRRLLQ